MLSWFDQGKTSMLPYAQGGIVPQKGVPMETINVEGLPEPVVRAVEAMVQTLREQLVKGEKKEPVELPTWRGAVIGSLRRKDIYDDVA
jgi:hypothetical protein